MMNGTLKCKRYNALYLEQPRDQKELEMYGMAYFNENRMTEMIKHVATKCQLASYRASRMLPILFSEALIVALQEKEGLNLLQIEAVFRQKANTRTWDD